MTRAFAVVTVLLATVGGSASAQQPAWSPTESSFVARQAGYELVPPPGWMRLKGVPRDALVLTRDGTALQVITVVATEVGSPLGPGNDRRAVTAGMSPHEVAELVADDVRATAGISDLQVVESAPATVSGKSGFRLVVSYRASGGLGRRAAIYGVVDGARLYCLVYVAPQRVYFARDLPVFDVLVRSFRLRAPEPPSRWQIQRRDGGSWSWIPLPL